MEKKTQRKLQRENGIWGEGTGFLGPSVTEDEVWGENEGKKSFKRKRKQERGERRQQGQEPRVYRRFFAGQRGHTLRRIKNPVTWGRQI